LIILIQMKEKFKDQKFHPVLKIKNITEKCKSEFFKSQEYTDIYN
jgi:hypothetical protein